ncbi:MAG: hypothetical protein MZW92_13070 [Comamonadaceae bacterium]|nr:hypothetical protein [Comamonadaceae bacterium]
MRWIGVVFKNAAGALLDVLGLPPALLPGIPGRGLLTILIGVMLLDFPGKRRIERRLVSSSARLGGNQRATHAALARQRRCGWIDGLESVTEGAAMMAPTAERRLWVVR